VVNEVITAGPPRKAPLGDDGGYVLPILGLLVIPLVVFTAFAIDLGAWYAQGAKMQRAADAAALAGVVHLPNKANAQAAAESVLRANGYTGAYGVAYPGERQMEISLTRPASQFFSQVVLQNQSLTRSGTAEWNPPVPLGSPSSNFGNNMPPGCVGPSLPCAAGQPAFWGSISAPFTLKSNGDPFSTKCASGEGSGCTTGNTEYRDTGYVYAISVPPGAVGQTLTVEVYDAGNYARPSYPTVETADNGSVNTMFEMFNVDTTPADQSDNTSPTRSLNGNCMSGAGRWIINNGTSAGTYQNQWRSICTITVASSGSSFEPSVYYLQVKSSAIPGVTDAGNGWNQFAVRASTSGGGAPSVYAVTDMSIFVNTTGTTTFYLAKIAPEHRGKKLVLSLFDPGDGQSGNYFVNVLNPDNVKPPCTYRTRGSSSSSSSSACRIQTRNSSGNTYNGQWLDITVDIPTTYACTFSDPLGCWWKIDYEFGGQPNDRTVWSARVIGDPVHLVE
jgi:hypothetical protein